MPYMPADPEAWTKAEFPDLLWPTVPDSYLPYLFVADPAQGGEQVFCRARYGQYWMKSCMRSKQYR